METKQNKRSWWVVEFEVGSEHEDMASWLMIHLGANGCQFISSKSDSVTLQATFERERINPDNMQALHAGLDEYGLGAVAGNIRIKSLEEEDWLSEWKKGLQPIKLGERLIVSPPWFENQIAASDLAARNIIWIEPGLAFGTGFHATTQFCLRAIEKHLESGKRILDVGTGSGILAIAAAMLLPEAVILALEVDPLACDVARENFTLNQADKRVELIEGSTEKVQGQNFDAILSNLTCQDNIALLPDYADLLEPGGKAIMSGILVEKLALLEKALEEHQFKIADKETDEMWAGLVVERLQRAR